MYKNRKSQEELIANFNERINKENYESGLVGKNIHMEGTPKGINTVRNWMGDAAYELGIGTWDLMNTPDKFTSDMEIYAGGGHPWGPSGSYTPAGYDYDWENMRGDWEKEDVTTIRPAQMTLSNQGVMSQEGTYPFPRDNILGHERWHASDIAFKQEKPLDILGEDRGPILATDDEYSRENLGLDDSLNMFGGPEGAKEFEALQRSWDRMPNQWSIDPKKGGYAGQNNDKYIKDDQMRNALVQMYMNSKNFKQLPEESRGPLALAMATALSSGEYEQNLGRDKEWRGGLYNPNIVMEPTDFTWKRWYDSGNPHIEDEHVQVPYEATQLSYLNHPDERTARFIGGAIGKGYDPYWRYGTKDSDEQYPELKKALGNWWRSD